MTEKIKESMYANFEYFMKEISGQDKKYYLRELKKSFKLYGKGFSIESLSKNRIDTDITKYLPESFD